MAMVIGAIHNGGVVSLLGGAAAMMVGAFGTSLFVADRRDTSPSVRALAGAAPIVAAVLVTRWLGHAEIAMGIVFGTSVAMMSTVVGSVCSIAPVGPAPGRWRRLWAFTIAAALIAFLAGFAGVVNWMGATVLAAEGLLMLWLWRDTAADYRSPFDNDARIAPAAGPFTNSASAGEYRPAPGSLPSNPLDAPPIRISAALAMVVGIGSVLLAGGGAALATRGAAVFSGIRGNVPTGTLAATLLSLALVMPSMQSARRLATAGLSWVPMTSQAGVVLINLCGLLPVLALIPYAAAHLPSVVHWSPLLLDWTEKTVNILPFPLAVWRVDAVLLVILSVLYLPVSMGRWNLGREEGMLLVIAYFAYLIAATVAGARV